MEIGYRAQIVGAEDTLRPQLASARFPVDSRWQPRRIPRASSLANASEPVLEMRNTVLRRFEFSVIDDHVMTSTIPRAGSYPT